MDPFNVLTAKLGSLIGESVALGAIFIFLLAVVGAKVMHWLAGRVASSLSRWYGFSLNSSVLEIIKRPLWLTILLVGAIEEIRWIGPPSAYAFPAMGSLESALLLIWAVAIGRLIRLMCAKWCSIHSDTAEMFLLTEKIGVALLFIATTLLFLAIWEVSLTPFLASAGVLGIIAGLAAKDTLGNFLAGVSLFLDRPFRRGDYIVLESGERGQVVDIGSRSTRILTRDDVLIAIPNSIIASTKIINESAPEPRYRVRTKVSVAYGSNLDQVEEILTRVAQENPLVVPMPVPGVRIRSLGDSGLDFELLCWCNAPADRGKVIHELIRSIYNEFQLHGIIVPFPQRDVHLHATRPAKRP